ncbi:MAG: transposase [Isosphaeraceae bacterium]
MARRLRIQYSDAIYHVMARGTGRQDIVQDDADRGRLVACLERAVRRSGWSLYAFVFLTNHLHLVLKTPRPNLAKGMQLFLSSYANGWARRHRHCGHLFQGRYRTELVEDETYLWVLTRYRPSQPRPGRPVRDAGGLDMVELPRVFPPPRSPGLGGLRRVACGLGRRVRTDRSGGILPSLRGGRSDYPACPPVGRGTAWMAPRQ